MDCSFLYKVLNLGWVFSGICCKSMSEFLRTDKYFNLVTVNAEDVSKDKFVVPNGTITFRNTPETALIWQ